MITPFNAAELIRQRVAADVTAQLPAGTFNLSVDQLALVLGSHPGHIRNQICQGVFPISTITIGSRRLAPLTSLIDYLAEIVAAAAQPPTKPIIGRPTKPAQRARETKLEAEKKLRAQTSIKLEGGAK